MIGGCEGRARTARACSGGDQILVYLKIRLKIEGVADVPALMAREAGEKSLTKRGGFLTGHRFGFSIVFRVHSPGDNFQRAGSDGEQGFALEKILKIAVEDSVHLQAVAAVFDDVGIDEAGNDAFADEGFAETLGENGGQVVRRRFGFRV